MNKKSILFAIAFMGSTLAAIAQNVTVLHMKDGTTRRYVNGVKEKTTINFFEFAPMNTLTPDYTATYGNGHRVNWNVNQVWHDPSKYVVGILWEDNIPANYQPKRGVCFGTKPGLTVDDCEMKGYCTYTYTVDSSTELSYMVIGKANGVSFSHSPVGEIRTDSLHNCIITFLEAGNTYYYRTFAEGKVLAGKDTSTVVFYGQERSFRVPYLIEDNGFDPWNQGFQGSLEAWNAWKEKFLPNYGYNRSLCDQAFNLWTPSEEIRKEIEANTEVVQFDNGVVNKMNKIHDAFYPWLTSRETVRNPIDDEYAMTVSKTKEYNYSDSVAVAEFIKVTDVDAKWGLPKNQYGLFTPRYTAMNQFVSFWAPDVVPGVPYKLRITFAPETRFEQNDSTIYTISPFLPTLVRLTLGEKVIINPANPRNNYYEVSGTDVTVIEVDSCISESGFGAAEIKIETRVNSAQLRNKLNNRILRISEVRFIPYKNEEN